MILNFSGEMKGTIHRQLLKEYEDQLQTGAALVLRQVNINHYDLFLCTFQPCIAIS